MCSQVQVLISDSQCVAGILNEKWSSRYTTGANASILTQDIASWGDNCTYIITEYLSRDYL